MQYALPLGDGPDLERIRARLLAIAGPQRDAKRHDPISQLVYGILSARTYDAVARAAFERLKRRYTSWNILCRALPREVEPLIRAVTYADAKANFLPAALRTVAQRRGALDLEFLADRSEEAGMDWLCGLSGVDVKVAATVLNFSTLRKRVLAVDTHLLRVGERLGLLSPKPSYRQGHVGFMRLIPNGWDADDLYEFHWLLKYHGQLVCSHKRPACPRCPLRDLCPASQPSRH